MYMLHFFLFPVLNLQVDDTGNKGSKYQPHY